MGMPVVTVATGGRPVVEATFGTPVTEAANKYGMPVTKVVGKPGLPVVFETIGVGGGAFSAATFNGTPSASIVMSNGNLTVTRTASSNGLGVRSASTQTTGKFYFEVLLQTSINVGNEVCIQPFVGGVFQQFASGSPGGVGVYFGGLSNVHANSVNMNKNIGAHAIGARLCAAIDLTARLAWFRFNAGNWNGDGAANPATGAGGVSFPSGAVSPLVRFDSGSATDAFTANFGATAFAHPVPAGFTSGWPV